MAAWAGCKEPEGDAAEFDLPGGLPKEFVERGSGRWEVSLLVWKRPFGSRFLPLSVLAFR